ncbi:response regulator [Agrobacterium vitis]|uniref:response regulator n=1 Tax=Agrobacterium vitis TaxID=373 RepID=UPI0012E866DD|nr:response regulator [Agrobacterium vitis]MVA38048.1 response regulator [Agrobacterium vitis]MVA82521.1 response regulator [Agrobacterium vitis]
MVVQGCRVLIVEDEYLIAHDLGRYFENKGAVVLGPVATVEQAAVHVDFADAAVLDIDLNGQRVFPIADKLTSSHTPFIFYTGRNDISIPTRFRHVGSLAKPLDKQAVFQALFPVNTAATDEDFASEDVYAVLPKLRLAALLLLEEAGPADRLVEMTLERAIIEIEDRQNHRTVESWLNDLLEDTYTRSGHTLLL